MYPLSKWSRKPPVGAQINWGHPLAQRLVSLWMLNESSGMVRDLVREEPAAISGTAPGMREHPLYGPGRTFNGSTHYLSANSYALPLGNNFTFASAFNCTNLATRNTIFATDNAGGAGAFSIEVGSLAASWTNSVVAIFPGVVMAIPTLGIVQDRWYLIHYVKRGTGATNEIYHNGIKQTLATNTNNNYSDVSGQKVVGGRTTTTQRFSGAVSFIALWGRALSPTEIRQFNTSPFDILLPHSPQRSWFSSLLTKNYYTGGISAAKRMVRGIGF